MYKPFKNIFKALLVVAAASSLSACGVGVSHDDEYTNAQQKDNDALTRQYSYAAGTYEGSVVSATAGQPLLKAHMYLFISQQDAGSNPDGTRKNQATLMGRFLLDDYVSDTDYTTLVATYAASTGAITLSGSNSASSGGTGVGTGTGSQASTANAVTLEGNVAGENANITVKKGGRVWGQFTAARTSANVTAPVASDDIERRERLFTVYQKLVGSYSSRLLIGTKKGPPVSIEIGLNETPSQTPGVTIPILTARYRRLDDTSGTARWQMSVGYDQLSNRISMTAISGGSVSVPGSNILSAAGTWYNGTLDVAVSDGSGFIGQVTAPRQ